MNRPPFEMYRRWLRAMEQARLRLNRRSQAVQVMQRASIDAELQAIDAGQTNYRNTGPVIYEPHSQRAA